MKKIGFSLLLMTFLLQGKLSLAAEDCEDFFNDGAASQYQITCEEENDRPGGDSDAKISSKTMTAFARDASHFVVVYRVTAGIRTYLTYNDNVNGAARRLLANHGDTKPGRSLGPIDTLETTARINGTDQRCLVFQRVGRKEYSGYKKVNLGMVCTQQDISLAYQVLEKLSLHS
jgi:hypothetical protein